MRTAYFRHLVADDSEFAMISFLQDTRFTLFRECFYLGVVPLNVEWSVVLSIQHLYSNKCSQHLTGSSFPLTAPHHVEVAHSFVCKTIKRITECEISH
jgi:hypothetical protein